MKWFAEQTLADVESVARLAGVTSVFATRQKIRNRHCGPQRPFALSMARSGTAQAHRRDRPKAAVRAWVRVAWCIRQTGRSCGTQQPLRGNVAEADGAVARGKSAVLVRGRGSADVRAGKR
jgi:hypothetical protein